LLTVAAAPLSLPQLPHPRRRRRAGGHHQWLRPSTRFRMPYHMTACDPSGRRFIYLAGLCAGAHWRRRRGGGRGSALGHLGL